MFALALASCGGAPEPTQPAQPAPPPAAAPAPAQPPAIKAGWVVQDMRTPESAYLDEASGYLFVSQIDGQPNEKDGKGRISKVGLDGSVVTADWFTAVNAPKGLRSFGGTLWVADLDEVIGIDIASGKENARVKIDGAIFLNDVAVGADGTVYVSDMMANKIYAIKDGEGDRLCRRGAAGISERLVRRGRAAGRRRLGQQTRSGLHHESAGPSLCARSENKAEDAHHQAAAGRTSTASSRKRAAGISSPTTWRAN